MLAKPYPIYAPFSFSTPLDALISSYPSVYNTILERSTSVLCVAPQSALYTRKWHFGKIRHIEVTHTHYMQSFDARHQDVDRVLPRVKNNNFLFSNPDL